MTRNFILVMVLYLLFPTSTKGETSIYVQNNSSLAFTVSSVQTGSQTMDSDEWSSYTGNLNSWELEKHLLETNRDAGIHNGTDFYLTTSLSIGVESINLQIRLNGNFTGSDMWHSLSGPGFDQPWYNDRNFHEETFIIAGKQIRIKYTAYFTGGYDDILYTIQEISPYPIAATDLSNNNILNILSYNIYMLSPPIASTDQGTRANHIHNHVHGYDALILSEAFDNTARATLINNLAAEYPFNTGVVDEQGSSEDGGLIIFSRWPILFSEDIVYDDCDGSDCLAAKGAMYAKINKSGQLYHVFGTHLQAWPDPVDVTVRQAQLTQLRNFIDIKNIPLNEPVIIGGDLNVDKTASSNNEYVNLYNILNAIEPTFIGEQTYSYDYLKSSYASAPDREYLDYVFHAADFFEADVYTNEVQVLRSDADEMWDIFDLSDHLAIHGRFQFPDCPLHLSLNNPRSNHTIGENHIYQVSDSIYADNIINDGATISYKARNIITLGIGFQANINLSGSFDASIQNCP